MSDLLQLMGVSTFEVRKIGGLWHVIRRAAGSPQDGETLSRHRNKQSAVDAANRYVIEGT